MSHSTTPVRLSRWSLDGLSEAVQERLLLAKVAGVAVWLAWFGSLALGGWTHDATGHPAGADHVQYYVVGGLVAAGHSELIYDLPTMTALQAEVAGSNWEGVLPFRYPPFYSLCFVPTSYLPYLGSWLVGTALGLLALCFAAAALGVKDKRRWLVWAFCFYPVFAAISFGQNSLFSLAFFAATFALLQRNRPFLAGMVAGLLLFKPQLLVGVGLLWLIDLRRSWRALLGLAVTGCLLLGVSVVALPGASRRFVEDFAGIMQMASRASLFQMHSTQGFWMLLLPGHEALAKGLSVACSLVGVAPLVVVWRRCRDDVALTFAAAVLLTVWISPYVMIYDWSVLLVPATLLWQRRPSERPRWRLLFAALWLVSLASGPLVRGQEKLLPFAVQISVPVFAAVLVAGWWGLKQRAPRECVTS